MGRYTTDFQPYKVEAQYIPIPVEMLQGKANELGQIYQQMQQGEAGTTDYLAGQETFDPNAKNYQQQQLAKDFGDISKRYNGDLARASSDIIDRMAKEKQAQFYNLNKKQQEQAKMYDEAKMRFGEDFIGFSDPRQKQLMNLNQEGNANWVKPQELLADTAQREKFDKYMEQLSADLKPDTTDSELQAAGWGMLKSTKNQELSVKKVADFLGLATEMVKDESGKMVGRIKKKDGKIEIKDYNQLDKIMADNPNWTREVKELKKRGASQDEIYDYVAKEAWNQIADKPYSLEDKQYHRNPMLDLASNRMPDTPTIPDSYKTNIVDLTKKVVDYNDSRVTYDKNGDIVDQPDDRSTLDIIGSFFKNATTLSKDPDIKNYSLNDFMAVGKKLNEQDGNSLKSFANSLLKSIGGSTTDEYSRNNVMYSVANTLSSLFVPNMKLVNSISDAFSTINNVVSGTKKANTEAAKKMVQFGLEHMPASYYDAYKAGELKPKDIVKTVNEAEESIQHDNVNYLTYGVELGKDISARVRDDLRSRPIYTVDKNLGTYTGSENEDKKDHFKDEKNGLNITGLAGFSPGGHAGDYIAEDRSDDKAGIKGGQYIIAADDTQRKYFKAANDLSKLIYDPKIRLQGSIDVQDPITGKLYTGSFTTGLDKSGKGVHEFYVTDRNTGEQMSYDRFLKMSSARYFNSGLRDTDVFDVNKKLSGSTEVHPNIYNYEHKNDKKNIKKANGGLLNNIIYK